jgi:hypothetical protein
MAILFPFCLGPNIEEKSIRILKYRLFKRIRIDPFPGCIAVEKGEENDGEDD